MTDLLRREQRDVLLHRFCVLALQGAPAMPEEFFQLKTAADTLEQQRDAALAHSVCICVDCRELRVQGRLK